LELLSDWIQAIMAIVTGFATAVLTYYAYVTIDEGKKNRRKDTMEKMLENLYSPLYELLRRARHEETDERRWARQQAFSPQTHGPRDYAFKESEFAELRRILERYGHYLDEVKLMKLNMDLDKFDQVIPSYKPGTGPHPYYRFWNGDMDPYFDYVRKRCEELREQLQQLTMRF